MQKPEFTLDQIAWLEEAIFTWGYNVIFQNPFLLNSDFQIAVIDLVTRICGEPEK